MAAARLLSLSTVPKRSISYCVNIVRNYDKENYLCSLLLPEPQKSFAFALRAMNVELAQVRDHALKSDQARVRFVFWREVVDGLFKSEVRYDTPVVRALFQSVGGMKVSKYLFLRLIEARERHFTECAFTSLKEAERYAEDTNVSLLYLISEAYGIKSIAIDHALNHLGQAQGLVNLLRGSVPLARRRRVVILPLDLLNKHNLSQEIVLRLLRTDPTKEQPQHSTVTESLLNMYHDLASVAHQHACTAARLAQEAAEHIQRNDKRYFTGFRTTSPFHRALCRQMLPLIPISDYLDQLRIKANFDPRCLDSRVDGLLPLRISWQAWRNRLPRGPSTS